MKKDISKEVTENTTICDFCGIPIDYIESAGKAFTLGGIGINWEKLDAVKVAVTDQYEFDFHKQCLVKVILGEKPAVLRKARADLFKKKK